MCPVNCISDIMHPTGNLYKLNVLLRIIQLFQDIGGTVRHHGCMSLGMIRIPHRSKIIISLADQGQYFFIFPYFLFNHNFPLFCLPL